MVLASLFGAFGEHRGMRWWTTCTAQTLSGAAVDVTLTNVGEPMIGQGAATMGGMMRLWADQTTVAHGTVSFVAIDGGSVNHELLVLPIPDGQIVGTRPVAGDARIDEQGG